jgi:Xaa-Pro aminopeptidase
VNPSADIVAARLACVRANAADAGVDALVITHLPNVQYLTSFTGTAGAVLLLPRACLLVVDFRYLTAATDLASTLGGLVTVETFEGSYDEALMELLRRDTTVRPGIEAAHLSVSRFNALSRAIGATLIPTERVVERARVIKDSAEIAALREGGRRLAEVARVVPAMVREGRSERAIAAEIDAAMRETGFSRPAFETIAASGPNGALPHARPTDRVLLRGDATVLDFGGVYGGYCVDLTRTVQLGAAGGGLERLYETVAQAQQAAMDAVRPGVASSSIDTAARAVIEGRGLGAAFGHATGHGLGLEVHEEPRIARPAAGAVDQVLRPGMVFTIEPGVYVPGVGGVRLEDDVLVTENGYEVLTR